MSRRRRDGERGASIVELALIAPVLIMLAIGAVEVGIAWTRAQAVVQATATGARTATQSGVAVQADHAALRSIKAGLGDNWAAIERVVVYEADSAGNGQPPAACIATGVTTGPSGTNCNVYTGADLAEIDDGDGTDDDHFADGPDCGSGRSANWCPSDRDADLRTAQWLGVWVEYEQAWLSGAIPFVGDFTIIEHTVMRLEPRAV
ncbi:MAG: TadE family protein [Actinomycetota bacterium]